MGVVNKDSPCFKAGSALRAYAREVNTPKIAFVLRMLDSRLQYFRDWEGSCQEGYVDHLHWAWSVQSELRDLTYLGIIPGSLTEKVNDLLEEAVQHSFKIRNRRIEAT